MKYRPLLVIVCLLCLSSFLAAQPAESTKTAPAKNVAANSKTAKDPEAERILRERRANAQSMLMIAGFRRRTIQRSNVASADAGAHRRCALGR
mgnify:CR=1 FL=1